MRTYIDRLVHRADAGRRVPLVRGTGRPRRARTTFVAPSRSAAPAH